jgi:hypothetical protein
VIAPCRCWEEDEEPRSPQAELQTALGELLGWGNEMSVIPPYPRVLVCGLVKGIL